MNPKRVLLGGTLFYVLLAPFFFHPDLKTIFSLVAFLWHGVFNIYAAYDHNPQAFALGPFVYPPLAYFVLGSVFPILRLLGGSGFVSWLGMGNNAVQLKNIFQYLLVLKLPIIGVHLLSGIYLIKLVEDKKKALVALLWFFNPITIYIVALAGQIDGLAMVGAILALFWAKTRPEWGAISLGLGAAIKTFPALLVPFYLILSTTSWKKRATLAVLFTISYGVWLLPFLRTSGFYSQTLASGLSKSVLTPWTLGLLGLITIWGFFKHPGRIEKLNNYFLLVGLVILAGIQFHPQWMMWLMPFAVVFSVSQKKWLWGISLTLAWVGNLLSFADKFLTWGLLSPLNYGVYFLPSPIEMYPSLITPIVWLGRICLIISLLWTGYVTLAA